MLSDENENEHNTYLHIVLYKFTEKLYVPKRK
jgi:hypothetical protein